MKLKFQAGGIKELLIHHGEKIGLGIAAICFGLFVFSAVGRETLPADKEPEAIKADAQRAQDHILNSKPEAIALAVVDYKTRAKRDRLDPEAYKPEAPLNAPTIEGQDKRGEPLLYPLEKPVAVGGFGSLALKVVEEGEEEAEAVPAVQPGLGEAAPGGGVAVEKSRPEGRYWAVVTGLFPIGKQFDAYRETFDNALGPKRESDVPQYRRPQIERATVESDDLTGLKWEPANIDAAITFSKQWATTMRDVVHAQYLNKYTAPLPPLLGVDWDDSVAHPPEIPLFASVPDREAPVRPEAKPEEEEEMEEEDKGFAGDAGPAPRVQRPIAIAEPIGNNMPTGIRRPLAEHQLLRFFDFSVQPGKKYRYRIKLALANPNVGIPDRFLKSADLKTKKVLETEWSEPTPIVSIPLGFRVLAGPASSGRDGTVKMRVSALITKIGFEVPGDMEAVRGSILNFTAPTVKAKNPAKRGLEELKNVRFETNAIVLDVRGGKRLSTRDKTLIEPSEVLIVHADGSLSVNNELDDKKSFDDLEPPVEKEEPTASGTPGAFDPTGGSLLTPNPPDPSSRTRGVPRRRTPPKR